MLLAVLTMVCGSTFAAETTKTWVAADQGYTNAEEVLSFDIDENITVTLDKGTNSNSPKYYNTGSALRVYRDNTFTISGASTDVTIKKIVFTFASGENDNAISSDVETYADGTWEGESQSVTFTIGAKSDNTNGGHRRIASIEVTYDVAEAPVTENTVTWLGAESTALPTEIGNDITFAWLEASGDQPPSFNSTKLCASMKKNNKLTIAGADANVTISEIVFTFDNSSDPGLSANVGSCTNNWNNNSTTWTGEANSITFTASSARLIKSIKITYTGSAAPVVKAPVLVISQDGIADTYDMDANGVFVVYYKNAGNAAAENTKLTLYVDGTENASKTIGTLNAGENSLNFWNAKYDLTNLEAGEHQVYLSLSADNADPFTTDAKTVTFTKAAPEPAFSITANAVTVPYNATSYDVVATLTETNNVDATNVKVELRKGLTDVLATKTVDALAAGGEAQVTLTVAQESFETGEKTYNLYVNDKFLSNVTITFEEAPVTDVKDLAITEVLGTIELANETNNVRVSVKNNGNVDINDAPVTLTAGETVLGSSTVSAVAGQTAFCFVTVASEGLTAGELAVTATVEVEDDATPEDNTLDATLTVNAIPAPEVTLTLTAQDVEVTVGEEVSTTVTVANTSEVDAENITVNILYNMNVLASQTIETLAAGASTNLVFTLTAEQSAMLATLLGDKESMEFNLQAMTADNKFGTSFTVTVKKAVEQVVDINLIDIRGISEINLANETNAVQVWFDNNSTVEELNATITLTMNGTEVGTETIAKGDSYKSFTLPTEGLVAGETATLVATLTVENNKEGNTEEVSKTLDIVSGETAPAAEISINPISGWEVEAGEQTVNVTVTLFNNGDVDAENVQVELYHSYGDGLCEPQIVNVPAGEENNWKILNFSFNYTFEEGRSYEFTAFTNFADADPNNQMQSFTLTCPAPVANISIAKINTIEATTEEDVVIAATLTNNSDVEANEVKVGVYKIVDLQYQIVGIQQTIESIAAGEQAPVEFNLGKLEAGDYTFYVQVVSVNGNATNTMREVTVKVTEPVVANVEVELTQVNLSNGHIDLAADSNTLTVWMENKGNVNADAVVNVTLNNTPLEAQTITVNAGKNGNAIFFLPTEGLVAGEKATITATITVEDNTSENISETKEYDIVDSSSATEPVFTVVAPDVEVEFGATSFDVVATVENISGIDAENVEVSLFHNGVIATQTIETLPAAMSTTVTFADVENPFTKAGEYTMYVLAPQTQTEVKIIVKPEAVEEVKDVAIEAISGTLDLNYETGNVTVTVKNNGNVDVADVPVVLTAGETTLGQATIASIKAGENGYAFIQVSTEGLEAGELTVTATADFEDADATNNTMTETLTVNAKDTTQPTFSVTADDVTVPFGELSFDIVATITNTSEVDAEGLTVTLLKGITEVETRTLDILLQAGQSTTETFTITADEEGFEAGTTASYYVQVANQVQDEVVVTFEAEPVTETADLAITQISGSLSLDVEENSLGVYIVNNGTKDIEDARVTLTYGNAILESTISVNVGGGKFCWFTIPATDLQEGELIVKATVEVENDATPEDNTFEQTYNIAAPAAVLTFTVEDVTAEVNAASFPVTVKVKNTGKGAATDVAVKIYDANSQLLAEGTIPSIAPDAEESITITVNKTYTDLGTFNNQLQVWVAGAESGVAWVPVTVTDIPNGIAVIKAQYGEDVQIYNLNGIKVNDVRKGNVYIVNGKKMVIK